MHRDYKKAESIAAAAERDMGFTLKIVPSGESGATIIRNIYECFRMLGDALLVSRGLRSEDHTSQIRELVRLGIKTSRPVVVIENLKFLRHSINYRGYSPTLAEIEDSIDMAKKLFRPLLIEVKKKIRRTG